MTYLVLMQYLDSFGESASAKFSTTVIPRGGKPFDSLSFPAREVDPTGAGDVFTAAFLIRLHETDDLREAARFANCTASFNIEAEGTLGIPTREMVEQRLKR